MSGRGWAPPQNAPKRTPTELKEEGKAVFLNSHLLSELEIICDRVAIMVKGLVRMQGTVESLTMASRRYEIESKEPLPSWAAETAAEVRDTTMILHGDDPAIVQPILDRLRSENITVISVKPVRENLEDLFMRAVDHTDNPGAIQ